MKKFVVCIDKGTELNSSSKARNDVEEILRRNGCVPIRFSGQNNGEGNPWQQAKLLLQMERNWRQLKSQTGEYDLVFFQYPHYPLKTAFLLKYKIRWMQSRKHLRFVAVVHDLNSLRGMYGSASVYSDTKFLPVFDVIICHNNSMKDYLIQQGIPERKLCVLGLFDYLTNENHCENHYENHCEHHYENHREHHLGDGIVIAGNLEPKKSGYIAGLIENCAGCFPIHLYGKGITDGYHQEGVYYHGAFPPDELPGKLEGTFGLVWDGPNLNSCEWKTGEYLRYNNPHKVSLYLTAGMPVIIWKESALAGFVRDHGIGITVDSLKKLDETIGTVQKEQYKEMCRNAEAVGACLRKGEYLQKALAEVESRMEKLE